MLPRKPTLNHLFSGLILAVLIAGCRTLGPLDADLGADFRLRGKIGVRGVDGEGAFSASFDWVQAGDAYRIELWGPFGHGRVRLAGNSRGVTITDARGRSVSEQAPEVLMERELGWSVPVRALRHWVRGSPAPGQAVTGSRKGEGERLTRFEQRGWVVKLSRWRDHGAGGLPGRIVATQPGRRVTVVCKEWW